MTRRKRERKMAAGGAHATKGMAGEVGAAMSAKRDHDRAAGALRLADRVIEAARVEGFALATREDTRAYFQHIADVLLDEIEAHGFNAESR